MEGTFSAKTDKSGSAMVTIKPITNTIANTVGSFFFLIGQVLITMNAQNITQSEKILNPTNISNGELNQKIDFLYNELMKIKRNLNDS